MIWPPEVLATIAGRVGFTGPELDEAVALALTVSGGDDQYRHATGAPRVADARGLWGVDVVTCPQFAGRDLYSPGVNAAAAWMLYAAADGSWAWSPAWRAGFDPEAVAVAQEAVRRPSEGVPVDWSTVRAPLDLAAYRAHTLSAVATEHAGQAHATLAMLARHLTPERFTNG